MPELSLYNIDRITRDIRKEDIAYSHLFDDLVDHVCCDVEDEMSNGLGFTEAYKKVKERIGFRGLKKIQEETLYAVDTKYRRMKNTMKITGVAGAMMLGFAAMFKILHWPFAGVLLSLGAMVLSFLFLPSALVVLWKETRSGKKLLLFVSAFLGGVAFILGILFKVQHWPGASYLITLFVVVTALLFIPTLLASKLKEEEDRTKRSIYITGAAGFFLFVVSFLFRVNHWPFGGLLMTVSYLVLFTITLPWYTWHEWKNEEKVSARFIYMIVGPLLFILPAALVNLSIERSFEEGFFYHQEQQEYFAGFQEKKNSEMINIYRDSSFFPVLEKVHTETGRAIGAINRLEWKMVQLAEGDPGHPAEMGVSDGSYSKVVPVRSLKRAFSTGAVSDFLLPGCDARNELEKSLASLSGVVSAQMGSDWFGQYTKLLDVSSLLPGSDPAHEELILINALHGLTLLKSRILSLESVAFNRVVSQQ